MKDLNLRKLDISLLLVFLSVMRHQKLTLAAEELGLTQSAISHALARLRELLADKLFIRRPFGVEPTRRAVELAPEIEVLVSLARRVIEPPPAFDPAKADAEFRLCGLDFEISWFCPPLLRAVRQKAPGVRIVFRPYARSEALRGLAEGRIDLALGLISTVPADIESCLLFEESYVVAARAGHPELVSGLDLDRYCQLDHLLVSIDGSTTGTVDAHLRELGRRRHVAATVPLFLPAMATVSESDLIVTLPERVGRKFAQRFGVSLHAPPLAIRPFGVSAYWHRRNPHESGLGWLTDQIKLIAVNSRTDPS